MNDFKNTVGIVGMGLYLPKQKMTAMEISQATGGVWSEEAVQNKLGILEKYIPSQEATDGTQEMGALAALDCLKKTGEDPMNIDTVLCIGEEWKEYPLTTSACYIQNRIGAKKAWALDLSNRCCTGVSALKIAKDILLTDEECHTVLVAGGYRNVDCVDYKDSNTSFMFDLSAGGAAILLKKNYGKNLVLGSHLMSNGSIVHTCGVEIGGTKNPVTPDNLAQSNYLRVMEPEKMKKVLNRESMENWMFCIDEALRKSSLTREDIGYLDILHMKRSGHLEMLKKLKLREDQTIYLERYGHLGQLDQILSLKLALEQGKVQDGTVVAMIAAGIGYTWAASIIKWGEAS